MVISALCFCIKYLMVPAIPERIRELDLTGTGEQLADLFQVAGPGPLNFL